MNATLKIRCYNQSRCPPTGDCIRNYIKRRRPRQKYFNPHIVEVGNCRIDSKKHTTRSFSWRKLYACIAFLCNVEAPVSTLVCLRDNSGRIYPKVFEDLRLTATGCLLDRRSGGVRYLIYQSPLYNNPLTLVILLVACDCNTFNSSCIGPLLICFIFTRRRSPTCFCHFIVCLAYQKHFYSVFSNHIGKYEYMF